jgi:hypothetical protein
LLRFLGFSGGRDLGYQFAQASPAIKGGNHKTEQADLLRSKRKARRLRISSWRNYQYLLKGRKRAQAVRVLNHPEWEPFERSSIEPLTPHRIYVEGPSSADPITLSPIASVELCPTCETRELFLLKEVTGKVITLRSGKDHEIKHELD